MDGEPRFVRPIEHSMRLVSPAPKRFPWFTLALRVATVLACIATAAFTIEPGREQFACSRCSAERNGVYITIAHREVYESAMIKETPLSRWLTTKLGPCQHQWRFLGRQTLWVRYCGKALPTLDLNDLLAADSPDLPLIAWLDRQQSADPSFAPRLFEPIGAPYAPARNYVGDIRARLITDVVRRQKTEQP